MQYSYLVTNAGNVTLTGIALSDDNDANNLACPKTSLAPSESMTCTATHVFTQAQLDANGSPVAGSGVLKNTVTATSTQAPPATDDLEIPIVRRPELSLVKSASPQSYNQVGQVITYTYMVTNTGNVTVVGSISVTDDKVTVVCPPTASLAPGQSVTCTASHTVTQADLDAGQIVNTASASNGVITSPPDTVTVGGIAAPRLVVVKSSPTKLLTAPQTVQYTYLVRNVGNVTVTGIALSDDNDNNDLSCPLTTLAPGALMTCTATHTFTQAELDANGSPVADSDKLANTVTATSNEAPLATDDLVIPIEQVPALTLVKSATPTSYDQVGDVISYSYKITNTGNVTLPGQFTVGDNKLTVTCPATATLAPGASITCTASHTVVQADLDAGEIVNVASASNGVVTSPPDTARVEAVQNPKLVVVKSSPTTSVSAPQTVSYTYVVTNTGNVTVTGITLGDNNDNNDLSCPQTTLAPTASMTCTATHTFTQAELDANGSPAGGTGNLANTVTATSDQAPLATDDLVIPIVRFPELTLVKSASPQSYNQVGQVITYTYVVTNTGNVTVVGSISVTDDKVTVVCPPTASLAPGQSVTCTASHTVTQADLDAGQIVNTASASNGVVTSPPDTVTVPAVQKPLLSVVKSSPTTSLSTPQTVNYTYLVKNTGNVTVTGIALVDDNVGGGVTCPFTSLAPGASMTCTASHVFSQAELDAGGSPAAGSDVLANTVTASSNEAADVSDNLVIPIEQTPELTLVKSASPVSYDHVGQVITYTYKVTNTGNVTLNGPFSVADNKVTVTCPPTSSLAPGDSITCTSTHAVTQADLDAGRIVNIASATNGSVTSRPDVVGVGAVAEPLLSVVKSSPTTGLLSPQTVSYSYLVTNIGNVTVTGIVLSDDNDNNDVSCPATSLPPTQSMTCTASHTFTQAELDANGSATAGSGSLTNTVTATSNQAAPASDTLSIPIVQLPRLTLVKVGVLDKTVVPPSDHANPGDRIDYTLTARNTGNVTLHAVAITDPLLSLSCTPAQPTTLAPGAQLVCHGSHTVTQTDLNNGSVTNTGSANGTSPDGTPVGDNDTSTVLLPPDASITLVKSAAEGSFHVVGDVLHYTYVVANTGNVRLAGPVTVTDDKTTVTCPALSTIGNHDDFLDPGESLTCTATYTVKQSDIDAGKVTNTASALVGGTGSSGGSVTVPFVKLDANIQIGPSATNPVGVAHTFTAHVNVNNGTGFVNAPDGTAISFTIVSGPGAFTSATPCATSGGTGSCSITLVSNVTGATVVSAQATVVVSGVSLTRQTNGTGGSSGPATKMWAAATARTDIMGSGVVTTVTAGTVVHDQVFVAKAAGTPDAAAVPTGNVVFHRYTTIDCTGTPTDQTVPLTPGNPSTAASENFAPTANISYRAAYLGDSSYAAVTGACEPLTVTPVPLPAITIVKNPAKQTVAFGGTAKFKITVTNTGNTVLTTVVVRDPAATNCKRTSAQLPALASMNPGASVTYSCAKTGVRAAFTNTATATGTAPSGAIVSGTDTATIRVQRVAPAQKAKPAKVTSHKKPKSTG